MLDHIQTDIGTRPIDLGIAHADAPDLAEELLRTMITRFDCRSRYVSYVGPSVGINTGPGATAIMYTKLS